MTTPNTDMSYYDKNTDKIKMYAKMNAAAIAATKKAYYIKNKDKLKAQHVKYRIDNKDKITAQCVKYRIDCKNKEKQTA